MSTKKRLSMYDYLQQSEEKGERRSNTSSLLRPSTSLSPCTTSSSILTSEKSIQSPNNEKSSSQENSRSHSPISNSRTLKPPNNLPGLRSSISSSNKTPESSPGTDRSSTKAFFGNESSNTGSSSSGNQNQSESR